MSRKPHAAPGQAAGARARPLWLALLVALGLGMAVALYAWLDSRRSGGLTPPSSQAEAVSPSAAAGPAANVGPQVSGRVVLASRLQAQLSPQDVVTLSAHLVDGPRLPVAVLKKHVRDLPLDFNLDASTATNPTLRLSPSMHVVVVARLSRAGQTASQPGEPQGYSQPVPVGSHGVLIEINDAPK